MPQGFGGPGGNSLLNQIRGTVMPSSTGSATTSSGGTVSPGGWKSNLGLTTSSSTLGAGQGPTPSTGQLADNPFNNTFNFQIPSFQPTSDGSGTAPVSGTGGGGGYSQYLPLIIVGLIVAGGAYFLFGSKK